MPDLPPILSYAKPDTDATFQSDESVICIHSAHGRVHRYLCLASATVILVLAGISLPMWLRSGEPGAAVVASAIYALVIGASISSGWWWTKVRIDFVTRELTVENRCGAFSSRHQAAFDDLKTASVEHDAAMAWSVTLHGRREKWVIAWGRNFADSVRIAREAARRLNLPLTGDETDQ